MPTYPLHESMDSRSVFFLIVFNVSLKIYIFHTFILSFKGDFMLKGTTYTLSTLIQIFMSVFSLCINITTHINLKTCLQTLTTGCFCWTLNCGKCRSDNFGHNSCRGFIHEVQWQQVAL